MAIVVDMANLSVWRTLSSSYTKQLIDVSSDYANRFGDNLERCVIVNAPGSFRMLWKLVASILGTKTLSKVSIHGSGKV